MRKLVLNLAVSLDGYLAGPNGEYDWCLTDQDYGMKAFFQRVDAVLMGGESYRLTKSMDGADAYPKMDLYVISKKEPETPGVTFLRDNFAQRVQEIKSQPGKDIWLFGGSQIIALMLQHRLVDELMMAVHPLQLGGGMPMFPPMNERTPWKLKDSIAYSSGLVQLVYTL